MAISVARFYYRPSPRPPGIHKPILGRRLEGIILPLAPLIIALCSPFKVVSGILTLIPEGYHHRGQRLHHLRFVLVLSMSMPLEDVSSNRDKGEPSPHDVGSRTSAFLHLTALVQGALSVYNDHPIS